MSSAEVRPEEIREIGRWPVRRYLGAGGFSWVFEVYDKGLKVSRALKLMKPEAAQGEGYKRFWREAEILASIDDPHLVRIYELDHDPQRKLPYYVMELLSGSDLAKLLKAGSGKGSPIGTSRTVEIFLGALQGLARLHELRPIIVHRDIKPANIWITDSGRAKLLDLGIAHVTRTGDETVAQSVLTVQAGFIGTIRYSSPEQLQCSELGPPSDLFSLGLCLFEALEGFHPYREISDLTSQSYPGVLSYYTRLQEKRAAIDLRFKRTPKPLREVVRRALSVRVEDRYRDAAQMREALDRAARLGASGAAAPADRRRLPAVLAAVMAAVLLTVAGGEAWRWLRRGSDATEPEVAQREESPATGAAPIPANAPSAGEDQPVAASPPEVDRVPPDEGRETVARAIPAEPAPPQPVANLSPRLVAREPIAPGLRIRPGEAVQLSVTVDDPDHDAIRYAWLVGGKARPETDASLTLRPRRSTQVQVKASDTRDAAIEPQTWRIEVVNAAPKLELTPSENLEVKPGESVEFTAEAWDPDGDEVKTEFLLNGRRVAGDRSYRFQQASAGRYALAARATDEFGATTSAQRSIEVASAAPPPPVAGKLTAAPSGLAPEAAARSTIERYRSAYNTKDLSALSAVWNMNPEQKKGTQKMFAAMDRVDLEVEVGEVRRSDDDPNVVFVQIEQRLGGGGGTFLGSNKTQRLTATVTLIGNSWKITNLSQRAK